MSKNDRVEQSMCRDCGKTPCKSCLIETIGNYQEALTEALKPRVCRWNTNDPSKDGWYRVTMDATPRYIGEAEWIRGGWAWAEADVLAWKPLSTPWEG